MGKEMAGGQELLHTLAVGKIKSPAVGMVDQLQQVGGAQGRFALQLIGERSVDADPGVDQLACHRQTGHAVLIDIGQHQAASGVEGEAGGAASVGL